MPRKSKKGISPEPPITNESNIHAETSTTAALGNTYWWLKYAPAVSVLIAGMVGVLSFFYFFYGTPFTDRIKVTIQESAFLKEKFAETQAGFDKINARLDKMGADDLGALMLPLKNPSLVLESFKQITSGKPESLTATLPEARRLLPILRDSKGKIPERAYQEASRPLLKQYPRAEGALKNELWLTVVELTTTKSVTDSRTSPLGESELKRITDAGKLFEDRNKTFDLSEREQWKDVIFRNCKVTVSNPKKTLELINVRFLDVDFQSMAQNQAGENLVAALLSNNSSAITKNVVEFKVNVNVVVPCCLKPMEVDDKDSAAVPKKFSFVARRHH